MCDYNCKLNWRRLLFNVCIYAFISAARFAGSGNVGKYGVARDIRPIYFDLVFIRDAENAGRTSKMQDIKTLKESRDL